VSRTARHYGVVLSLAIVFRTVEHQSGARLSTSRLERGDSRSGASLSSSRLMRAILSSSRLERGDSRLRLAAATGMEHSFFGSG